MPGLSCGLRHGFRGRLRARHEGVSRAAHRGLGEVGSAPDVPAGLADLGVPEDLHDRGHVRAQLVQDRVGGVAAAVVLAPTVDASFLE